MKTMLKEEMMKLANSIRSQDHFGTVSSEEKKQLPGILTSFDIPVENGKRVRVYQLQPENRPLSPLPLIINYHGGGFIKGRSDRDWRYCSYLMEQLQCLVWDVDYCLAPEEPFPAAVEECYGVAAYAFSNAADLGIDVNRIAMAGHSAGGNLVAAVNIMDSQLHRLHPCALLMEYFPADHTVDPLSRLTEEQRNNPQAVARAERECLYQQFYCTPEEAENPLCSPIKASLSQLAAFPDCLVLSAGQDSLKTETEQFAKKLIEAGVTVTAKRIPEAIHGFTTNRTDGWEKALTLHCNFFARHFEKHNE